MLIHREGNLKVWIEFGRVWRDNRDSQIRLIGNCQLPTKLALKRQVPKCFALCLRFKFFFFATPRAS